MKSFRNEIFTLFSEEDIADLVNNLYNFFKESSFVMEIWKGEDIKKIKNVKIPSIPSFLERKPVYYHDGFFLIPTVKKTTLFYSAPFDCFIKIIHPLSIKDRIFSLFIDKGYRIYNLSKELNSNNIKVPTVIAYGFLNQDKKPFFVMNRMEGNSLYPVMIGNKTIPFHLYYNVIDEIIKLHKFGYWFGDFRLSHVFIHKEKVSGVVDIDSIKKNFLFKLRNLAKDMAGFNHPKLSLSITEKNEIFSYYIEKMNIKKKNKFLDLLKYYTQRRWNEM